MSLFFDRRRAAAALNYERPTGAAFRFTPESLQFSGGLVTGWRDEISGLVLHATGDIAYTPADPRLGNRATAELTRTSHFDTFPLTITGPFTVAVVLRQVVLADQFYQQAPFVLQNAAGQYYGFSNGEYGRNPNFNARGYDLINNERFDDFAPRAQVASFTQFSDLNTLRLFLNNVELAPLDGLARLPSSAQNTASIGYVPADTRYGYAGLINYLEGYYIPLGEQGLQDYTGWLNQDFNLLEITPY